jgi:hypothetical protein
MGTKVGFFLRNGKKTSCAIPQDYRTPRPFNPKKPNASIHSNKKEERSRG